MEAADIINRLVSLLKLDVDAVHAYEQALEKKELEFMSNQLMECRENHFSHALELKSIILKYGGDVPRLSSNFEGFMIRGFTEFDGLFGLDSILDAMSKNELLTNSTYDNVFEMDLPKEIYELVVKNRQEERQHLRFVEDIIANRDLSHEKTAA
jgi:hypothetical protein